jgi:hypothetical protein
MIYLNAVRIDHATESVVLDVAVLSPSVEHAALDQSPILHEACKVGVKITINQTSRREKRGGSCCLQHAKCAGRIGSTHNPATCAYYQAGGAQIPLSPDFQTNARGEPLRLQDVVCKCCLGAGLQGTDFWLKYGKHAAAK